MLWPVHVHFEKTSQIAAELLRISVFPTVGFSGTADRMDLLPVGPNPRWRLEKFKRITNKFMSEP